MIQMFDSSELWKAIGYDNVSGELTDNCRVVMERTIDSSPKFLESHSEIDDIIQFLPFSSEWDQAQWIAKEIVKNLKEDELRTSDIMVIHPDPFTAKTSFGPIRDLLFNEGINSSIAGVTSSPDEFVSDNSVTFTSIYRAKGNEAAMVYVMSADFCNTHPNLQKKRNTLFTAMTRTKAWVRVCGVGAVFSALSLEYEKVKSNNFTLDFIYPDEDARKNMKIVNKDMSKQEIEKSKEANISASSLANMITSGEISIDNIPEHLRKNLANLLLGNSN